MKTTPLRHCAISLAVLLLLTSAGAQSKARTYSIVAGESSFWVFVGKAGIFSGLAHNHEIGVKSFTGRVTIPATGTSAATLELEADAKSLAVLDKEVSDKDRTEIYNSMHTAVLESARYPKITFRSASVTDVKETGSNNVTFILNGDLTLHGVTRRIAVPVTATITPQQLKASGKYTLRQTDFGIRPYSAAGGTIKVKNEVVVNFAIVAKA
jgi:polyisoprenoid-binding protein YceI